MDLCLTARMMDAQEAERAGLVSRVVPAERLIEEAVAAAERIAGFSSPVVMMVKEAVNRAYESSLTEGLLFERRSFHAVFALVDKEEGMRAFVEKRKPQFAPLTCLQGLSVTQGYRDGRFPVRVSTCAQETLKTRHSIGQRTASLFLFR
jgi:1,4-dihydroxy-2-naphthoyl-CoA synthase